MMSTVTRPVVTGRVSGRRALGRRTPLAGVLGAGAVVLGVVSLVLVTTGGGWAMPAAREIPVDAAIGIAYAGGASLVLAGSGGRRLGWLLLGIGLAGAGAALTGALLIRVDEPSAGASALAFVHSWLWVPGFVPLLTLVPLLYPHGLLPGRRWWPAVVAGVAGMVLLAAGTALYPETYDGRIPVAKPVTSLATAQTLMVAAVVLLVPAVLAGIAALVVRVRGSQGLVRRQVMVFLVAAGVLVADTLAQPALPWPVDTLSQAAAVALVPVAIGVAVTRHRLYDLDVALLRTISVVSLAVSLSGAYLTLFALTDALLPFRAAVGATLSAAVTGVLVHPLGVRLHRGIERLYYGDRSEPTEVLARLSSGLREGLDLPDVPAYVCDGVVASLRVRSASLTLVDAGAGSHGDTAPVAESGPADGPSEALDLRHRGEVVAVLRVGPRPGETALDSRDRELLEMVCDQVAPTIAALRLAERLQQSRAAIVSAREEERRRLRRDLHDGVGATLAGLRLQVESAQELVTDPTARRLLDGAASGVASAVDDLRGITEDLRPPALEDLGLAGSLRALGDRMSTPSLVVVSDIRVDAALPAAVDVACYRIAAEALANAARHAGADAVTLRAGLHVGELLLEVTDDGSGLVGPARGTGLGLLSMRQRAEEIGGTLEIISGPDGTTVRARLPLEEPR
jgi:signal transduction histidine kinase